MYNTGYFSDEYLVESSVYEYNVPDGSIFVMGDNRNNSTDGRSIGFVSTDDVLGKAIFRLFPFNSIGKVK